jgi:hypothetical protein
MTASSDELFVPATRLTLDQLAREFDGHKAPTSNNVVDREIVVTNVHASRVWHRFDSSTVKWSYEPGAGDPHPVASGRSDYEAFDIAPGLVYTQFHHRVDVPNTAISLVLDFESGHSLAVVSAIPEPADDPTRVQHKFLLGQIEGLETRGPEPAPTAVLLGRRVRWTFSDEHSYEHAFVRPDAFTWQRVAGPGATCAETCECTAYQLRPGIFAVAARKKEIACSSVTIADYRDTACPRSHGAIFGLDETGAARHFTFGAVGELLNRTV